jgi:pimeloyl-ACP methyl ester carboxylesterase
MGGRVVIRLAADYATELGAVIGLEATDVPNPWYDNSWTDLPEFGHPDFCSQLVSSLVAPQSPAEFRWETLWHYFQGGHGVFRGDMAFFRTESDYRELAKGIDTKACPVYLLTGEYDFSCSPELTKAASERIPGAKVTIMEDMGHFPMSENPERFASYIHPILDELFEARVV